ncbi:unnamed protein product [Closterium sp. NIES-54]
MAEFNLSTLTQERLDQLVCQLEESTLEIATLMAERDSARQQSTANAPTPAPANAHAQSEGPIIISSGTPSQHDIVGQRSGAASDGAAQSMTGIERARTTSRVNVPRESRRHVGFATPAGNDDISESMPLKPQRPPCFDPSQRGGLTVQSWVFTMNVFLYANYVTSDAAKIRYAVSLLWGPAMDWWRVIMTSPRAYEPLSQEEEPAGTAITWTRLRRPAAAATARATAAAGGGSAGIAGSATGAGGAGCATGSVGGAAGAAGAGGAGPTTDRHCLSWPLSRQLQRLEQSRQETFSPQVLSELFPQRCVTGSVEAATPGASESAAALGASESAVALGASESAAALGARASPAIGPSSAKALHTFTLDSGAPCCFFRDCTSLTPLAAPVLVSLTDPTGGPVVARASTVLPCQAVPSDSLSRSRHTSVPSRSRRTCLQHLARVGYSPTRPSSGTTASVTPPYHVSAVCTPVSLSLAFPGPCPPSWQRAAPHSSEFPLTTAPLQTLHMDVWGPAPIGGTDQECYFLLVVDEYKRYTTVFPLRRKADVSGVLIPRIRATRRQLRERFSQDFPILRLHSDKDSEFSSDLLADFCRDEGIVQSFTLPASPQENGIAERRIGLIMEVAHTSMIHAAAPRFLWLFAVRYTAHQLNLWPRVSEPETSPTLWWTGKVGDALVFRVWGALSLVRDAKASKLSSRTLRCVFLGFPTDAPL